MDYRFCVARLIDKNGDEVSQGFIGPAPSSVPVAEVDAYFDSLRGLFTPHCQQWSLIVDSYGSMPVFSPPDARPEHRKYRIVFEDSDAD